MRTATYTVKGLDCGACIAVVMEEVRRIPGVSGVEVTFIEQGASPLFLESAGEIAFQTLRNRLGHAGFRVSHVGKRRADHLRRTFAA